MSLKKKEEDLELGLLTTTIAERKIGGENLTQTDKKYVNRTELISLIIGLSFSNIAGGIAVGFSEKLDVTNNLHSERAKKIKSRFCN